MQETIWAVYRLSLLCLESSYSLVAEGQHKIFVSFNFSKEEQNVKNVKKNLNMKSLCLKE